MTKTVFARVETSELAVERKSKAASKISGSCRGKLLRWG